jgi:hypothetical protein
MSTTTNVPISGYQSLIPAGANPQFNAYLQRENLDSLSKFVQFICFATVVTTMSWVLVQRVRAFNKYAEHEDELSDNFALFEDSAQKKLLRNGGGNSYVIAFILFVFSVIMSVNIWVSL